MSSAVERFEYGAFLLIENLPVGSDIGINLHAWQVGPKFRGIKMIPPGFHIVSCGISGGTSGTSRYVLAGGGGGWSWDDFSRFPFGILFESPCSPTCVLAYPSPLTIRQYSSHGMKISFMEFLEPRQIVVYRYESQTEELDRVLDDPAMIERYRQSTFLTK